MGVLPIGLAPEQSPGVIEEQNAGAVAAIRRHGMRGLAWLLLVTVAALIPGFAPQFTGSALVILVFMLLGTGLALEIGIGGVVDFAVTVNFAAGAYCAALLTARFPFPFWEWLPLCGAIGAVIAYLVAKPLMRRNAAVFAIATLSLNAVAQTVLNNWSAFTGGSAGLRLPAAADRELCYYIALGFAGFAGFVAWRLRRSPIALALRAAQQNEIACHSIGIDAPALRLTVVVLAGAIAGIAGGLFAAAQGYVRPEQFDISTTATLLVLMLLGGTRSQLRLALAAIGVVSVLLTVPAIAEDRLLIFGVALVVSPLLRRWAASSFAAPGSMSSALFAPKTRME